MCLSPAFSAVPNRAGVLGRVAHALFVHARRLLALTKKECQPSGAQGNPAGPRVKARRLGTDAFPNYLETLALRKSRGPSASSSAPAPWLCQGTRPVPLWDSI